jgi:hypothetical protein
MIRGAPAISRASNNPTAEAAEPAQRTKALDRRKPETSSDSRTARQASVCADVPPAPAKDDQEESEPPGDSCLLRPAIAVARARPDNAVARRPFPSDLGACRNYERKEERADSVGGSTPQS